MLDDEALYFSTNQILQLPRQLLVSGDSTRSLVNLTSVVSLSPSFDLFPLCVVITHLLSETSANEHQTQRLSSKLPPNQPNSVSESTPLLPLLVFVFFLTAFHFWLLLLLLLLQVSLEM